MENKKIALVLYTQGIDYDDRIRKEIMSVKQLYPNVSFKIFAVEPQNREESGVTSYGVPYRIPFLESRNKYKSGTHKLTKSWDFYRKIRKDLQSFDVVWCADVETFMFVFLLRKKILWDLHELPLSFLNSSIKRRFFNFLEYKTRVMVHANEARLNYLLDNRYIRYPEKQFVLRNYPQFNEIDSEFDDTYHQFVKWLGNFKCVYLQGINGDNRADLESIGAVMRFENLKSVVVGRINPDRMALFEKRFGKEKLHNRVFFTGQIKQLKTPQYIKKCVCSLVFYKNVSPNNWYCEPNRLFQSVINGVPVIVGNNPPLRDFVVKNSVGVSVDTDGSDEAKIVEGINVVKDKYYQLKENISDKTKNFLWSNQNIIIQKIVNLLLTD